MVNICLCSSSSKVGVRLVRTRDACAIRRGSNDNYLLPLEFLTEGGGGTWLFPFPDMVHVPAEPFKFESLRALIFKSVDVPDEVIEYMLSHCPSLEELVMWGSWRLKNLEISGLSLKLKHLEIRDCELLVSLKVYNMNLRSICIVRSHMEDTHLRIYRSL